MTVTFEHAGRTLSGVVARPAHGDVRAGLVFLHGSGPADAAHWSVWADAFAARGIASLSYDKPGVGASEGDWETQSFNDRAVEAVAAVAFLAEAVGERVGVLGMSQGAWIGPHSAAISDAVHFVVALSGSAQGPREQDRFRVAHELARDGFAPADVEDALAAWDACDTAFRGGADEHVLEATVAGYRGEPWFRFFVFADASLIPYGRLIWDYDPLPHLERCRAPLLAIWGSDDPVVDPVGGPPAFRRALAAAGNTRARLLTIHGADHGLRVEGERPAELFGWIAEWILAGG